MANDKVQVRMLHSLIGKPFYRKGEMHHLDPGTAQKWADGGLCEIVKEEASGQQSKQSASGGTNKSRRRKKSPES